MVKCLEDLTHDALGRGIVNTIMFSAGTLALANLIQYSRTYYKDTFSTDENLLYGSICLLAFGAIECVRYFARARVCREE